MFLCSMSSNIHKYKQEIQKHKSEIKKLNVLKFPTLENLDKRNQLLAKIYTLNYKLNNILSREPELGYAVGMDITVITD